MFKINDEVTIGTNLIVWVIIAIDSDVAWVRQKGTNNNRLRDLSDLKKHNHVFENFISFVAMNLPSAEIGLTFKCNDYIYKRIFKSIQYKNNKPVIITYRNGRNSFTDNGKEDEMDTMYLTNFELISK